ncbi:MULTISPECIES: hypothetical protein [unclassified Novosphingobium]|uniref:hypothetical protein n=1 Tax=unclassified Novosphingobium TaxID=2644732 RepID=UPI0025E887F9|nr:MULTISPECIES: hypothetical protein [unclassified Novosphingobium]HQV04019.1 hypothetical protein [Novosphingobium sp.]
MPARNLALSGLVRRVQALRNWAQVRRGPLLIAALALFFAGTWLSVRQLGLSPRTLQGGPLLIQMAIAPLSLLYAGIGMHLLARSAQVPMPLGQATALSAWATLAEALPLPGGAMVRAGALMAKGTGLARSSALVLANALLWISLAALGCGLVLLGHGQGAAGLLAFGGTIGSAVCFGWLTRTSGLALAMQTLAHRLSGMALIAVRLHFAFLTLGVTMPLADTLPFALANIAGSAASIAPAGLGISETLAAAAAGTVKVAPGAAFLAVGLDRLICLAASGLLALATARQRSAAA